MTDLIQLFNMAEALSSNPNVEVLKADVYAGTDKDELQQQMREVFADLPFLEHFDFSDILDFYAGCDGCDISWVEKGKEDPERGSIRILQFESALLYTQQVFTSDDTDVLDPKRSLDFSGVQYTETEFCERLFLFDDYAEQSGMALVFASGTQPRLMMLSDNYFDWQSSRLIGFKSYFRFLLASRGSYRARFPLFSQHRGDRLAPLAFDEVPYGTDVEPEVFKQ